MLLQVDQDRAVGLTLPPRPVIDTENFWRRSGSQRTVISEAQQRVSTDRHGLMSGVACAGFATKCQTDLALRFGESFGTPRKAGHDSWQPLDESPLGASRIVAKESTDVEFQPNLSPDARQVTRPPSIPAVSARRCYATARTACCTLTGCRYDRNVVSVDDGLIEAQVIHFRQDQLRNAATRYGCMIKGVGSHANRLPDTPPLVTSREVRESRLLLA